MASATSAQNNKSALETARRRVKEQYEYAKSEKNNAKSQTRDGSKKWKGDNYKRFDKDRDLLLDYYSDWLWKWGWGDDGSINGIIDKLDQEIGDLESFLDSLFN